MCFIYTENTKHYPVFNFSAHSAAITETRSFISIENIHNDSLHILTLYILPQIIAFFFSNINSKYSYLTFKVNVTPGSVT